MLAMRGANLTAAEMQKILMSPAAHPPPGVLSNFNNPPGLTTSLDIWIYVTLAIATLAVAVRIFVRKYLVKMFEIEDC